jgi:hypothetical protein
VRHRAEPAIPSHFQGFTVNPTQPPLEGMAEGLPAPPPELIGAYVEGTLYGERVPVRAEDNYRAFHELEDIDADRTAYATVYQYPRREYLEHLRAFGSPAKYAGPSACCRLVWDIDREANLEAALADTRKMLRYLRDRYGDAGCGLYFSGVKGFHITLLAPSGYRPNPQTSAVVKALCQHLARAGGVVIDRAVYDTQRLFRLPNSRHPKSGLYKRYIDLEDFDRLDLNRILKAAKNPAGFAVPTAKECCTQLADDWSAAEEFVRTPAGSRYSTAVRVPPSSCPVVPKFVLDFIGFGDIQDPGRAVTLFRCAAALAEADTPDDVVCGLLEEVALKSGLDAGEVRKQIDAGIRRGRGVSCRS